VSQSPRKNDTFIREADPSDWVSERSLQTSAEVQYAHARIVSEIDMPMVGVTHLVVENRPGVDMLAGFGKPSGVRPKKRGAVAYQVSSNDSFGWSGGSHLNPRGSAHPSGRSSSPSKTLWSDPAPVPCTASYSGYGLLEIRGHSSVPIYRMDQIVWLLVGVADVKRDRGAKAGYKALDEVHHGSRQEPPTVQSMRGFGSFDQSTVCEHEIPENSVSLEFTS
jgi:hypothetical protein